METTLYIIRHGQREDSIAGHRPAASRPCDPDITAIGRQQAKETGSRLADKNLSIIYASPFLRTMTTASLIAEQCKVKIRPEWGLAEWFRSDWWSEWPGTISVDVLHRMFPMTELFEPSGVYPVLGEDQWSMFARYLKTAQILAERHAGENIAFVTHGGAIMGIPTGLVSWDVKGWEQHRQCGISKLVCKKGKWKDEYLNDVSHLTHVET